MTPFLPYVKCFNFNFALHAIWLVKLKTGFPRYSRFCKIQYKRIPNPVKRQSESLKKPSFHCLQIVKNADNEGCLFIIRLQCFRISNKEFPFGKAFLIKCDKDCFAFLSFLQPQLLQTILIRMNHFEELCYSKNWLLRLPSSGLFWICSLLLDLVVTIQELN